MKDVQSPKQKLSFNNFIYPQRQKSVVFTPSNKVHPVTSLPRNVRDKFVCDSPRQLFMTSTPAKDTKFNGKKSTLIKELCSPKYLAEKPHVTEDNQLDDSISSVDSLEDDKKTRNFFTTLKGVVAFLSACLKLVFSAFGRFASWSNQKNSSTGKKYGCILLFTILVVLFAFLSFTFIKGMFHSAPTEQSTTDIHGEPAISVLVNETETRSEATYKESVSTYIPNSDGLEEFLQRFLEKELTTYKSILMYERRHATDRIKQDLSSKSRRMIQMCRTQFGQGMDEMSNQFEALFNKMNTMEETRKRTLEEYMRHYEEKLAQVAYLKTKVDEMQQKESLEPSKVVDQNQIHKYVDDALTEMIANYDARTKSPAFVKWINDNFIRKDNLDAESNKLFEKLSTEIKLSSTNKLPTSADSLPQSSHGYINTTLIKTMIAEALGTYDADKTGLVDYALENGGAEVVSSRTSSTFFIFNKYLKLFGIPIPYLPNGPRAALTPSMIPGDCWPFAGHEGQLVVKLSRTIVPTSVSIEHIPRDISPQGDIKAAPRDFSILGLKDETDPGVSLGNYTYRKGGPPLQHFDTQIQNTAPVRFVALRVLNNHGMKAYTCLYRFRVHGNPLDGVDKLFE